MRDDRISPSVLLVPKYQLTVAGGRATVALASRAGSGIDADSGACAYQVLNTATDP